MIRAAVSVGTDGLLQRVEIAGHAGYGAAGTDIVCAAVTALVRSSARVLERDRRCVIEGEAAQPGSLSFEVKHIDPDAESYVRGVGDLLILGLADIAREYPDRCSLDVAQGAKHGA